MLKMLIMTKRCFFALLTNEAVSNSHIQSNEKALPCHKENLFALPVIFFHLVVLLFFVFVFFNSYFYFILLLFFLEGCALIHVIFKLLLFLLFRFSLYTIKVK